MLKILIKKQFTEIFKAYFYDTKKNTARSKAATIAWFVFYALLIVGIFSGIFGFLAYNLCKPMCESGYSWFYFAMMGMVAIALGVFGSVFNTFSGLYKAKDNDLLLSMPIMPKYIVISRLVTTYIMGLIYSGLIVLPTLIIYYVMIGFSAMVFLGGVLFVLILSLFVMVLACLLGYVVAKISARLKSKSFVTVFVSVCGMALYYFIYYKAQEWISNIIANVAVYGEAIDKKAHFVVMFGNIATGDILSMLLCTAITAVVSYLTYLLLEKTFFKIATANETSTSNKVKKGNYSTKSVFSALLSKEFGRFTASPNYMLNCGLGVLTIPLLAVLFIIKGNSIVERFTGAEMGLSSKSIFVLASCVVCVCTCMNDMVAPSVSLEGKNIWILQSMPVNPTKVLMAKLSVQLLLTALPVIFPIVTALVVLKSTALECVLMVLSVMSFVLMNAAFGLFLGTKMANVHWSNEMIVVKQSLNVGIALMFAMFFPVATAVGYFALKKYIEAYLFLSAFISVNILIFVFSLAWIIKKGAKAFSEL